MRLLLYDLSPFCMSLCKRASVQTSDSVSKYFNLQNVFEFCKCFVFLLLQMSKLTEKNDDDPKNNVKSAYHSGTDRSGKTFV